MESRSALPSDPDVLLEYLHDLPDESDSEDKFDGYLGPEDGPVAYRTSFEEHGDGSLVRRSASLDDLTALQSESPLAGLSPSPSPMEGQHASGSPLADIHSPSHSSVAISTSQVKTIVFIIIIMQIFTPTSQVKKIVFIIIIMQIICYNSLSLLQPLEWFQTWKRSHQLTSSVCSSLNTCWTSSRRRLDDTQIST